MDATNFKSNIKELSKIEDSAERLFFLRDLEKSFKALPKEQQEKIRREEEAFAIQLMAETEKFLEDKTLTEFPEPLKKLIEF